MKTRHGLSAWSLGLTWLLALSPGPFAANPPALIDYQGVLRSAADAPLSGTYDMTFRFFDAESGGSEILLDRHLASGAQAVAVDAGLFSVGLGGGAVSDGSGPGTYTSLSAVFRDYGAVWLEIEINSEVLAPRTRILAGAYALNATSAQTADQLGGHSGSYYLDTSATRQAKFGTLLVESPDATFPAVQAIADAGSVGALSTTSSGATCKMSFGTNGIECYGTNFGGFFEDSSDLSYAYIGTGPYGIYAASASVAGDFTSTGGAGIGVYGLGPTSGGQFRNSGSAAEALLGTGTYGVDAHGPTAGRFVQDGIAGNYTYLGYSGYGLLSKNSNGVHAIDITDSSWSRIGNSPYKVQGTGSVSFVQNHPDDPGEVVIYHAPESSEVNVYTRGSAKLVDGFARVELDPTFAWTANPDIGLTAHLTPRGEPVALAVEAVGARELLVRGPKGSGVAFDYWVTGLRIGFEEMPVVSPKEFESAIPARASGDETYAKNPALRTFNALERHRAMSKALGRAIDPELKAAKELRARIGIGQPAVSSDAPPAAAATAPPVAAVSSNRQPSAVPEDIAAAAKIDPRTVELFVARSSIEAGDVVVLDPSIPDGVRRCDGAADRKLVGVAVERDHDGKVAVAFAAIHDVLVDAVDHPVAVGDLLTTSATQGAAMRATTAEPGTILGKALEPLPSGVGTIRVLVMPR
jgi:hypothetical protein